LLFLTVTKSMNQEYTVVKVLIKSAIAVLLLVLFSAHLSYDTLQSEKGWFSPKEPPKKAYAVRKIVIDAGHGGHDPGCVGLKSKEKDVALAISLKLGAILERELSDVEVVYTRNKDVFLELHQRAAIANRNNADLFISIHCNAAESKLSYGTETFVLGLHRAKDNLDVAKRENASIYFESDYQHNYEGYDPNSAQGHILLSLFQNAYLDQSIFLAEKIERNFVTHKRSSRGVKQGGFLVLRHATMPAVLVEAGFLSHPEEEKWLISEEGQSAVASSIANAVKAYKESYDARPKQVIATGAEPHPSPKQALSAESVAANGVEFCVQLATAPSRPKSMDNKVSAIGSAIWRDEAGSYKLQLNGLGTYEEAVIVRDKARNAGFKDAFITAYKDSQKITVQDAIQISARLAQN
jgi:N-acetylmuramoyl-L-alanine amidase